MSPTKISCTCCIVGGGPAGIMLGFLLARQGINVCILEKHKDFFRDFRGDTIHPSTIEVLHELGLSEEFLKLPHQAVQSLSLNYGDISVPIADFTALPTMAKCMAFMPQWDFLNFLTVKGRQFPQFDLKMQTEAYDVIEENNNIVGVRARSPTGDLEIYANLVIAADGRSSVIRERAGLRIKDFGAPIDVLWLKIPKGQVGEQHSLGYFKSGTMMVLIDRGDYFQCGYIISKGEFVDLQKRGIQSFQKDITNLAPFLGAQVATITEWDQVRLLTVVIDRLEHWHRPGLLCIGDAAHAMSPAGGVGINLAIQDAVATANILGPKLFTNSLANSDLHLVQVRRMFPTKFYQAIQRIVHSKIFPTVLARQQKQGSPMPFPLQLLGRFSFLRKILARIIGLGVRPEHIAQ